MRDSRSLQAIECKSTGCKFDVTYFAMLSILPLASGWLHDLEDCAWSSLVGGWRKKESKDYERFPKLLG